MLAPTEKQRSPLLLALEEDLSHGRRVAGHAQDGLRLEAVAGREHLWLVVRAPSHAFALRACSYMAGKGSVTRSRRQRGELLRLRVTSLTGEQEVAIALHPGPVPVVEATCRITPRAPLVVPFLPRDFVPLDAAGSPSQAGRVEAAQRGMNSGLCFVRCEGPARSTMLYWQDFTALNPYFAATGTAPDGVVGGEWPELGFRLPTAYGPDIVEPRALPAGRPVTLSRALVALHDGDAREETDLAVHFLDATAAIYPLLDKPRCELRDWPRKATATARDIARAEGATVTYYGQTYVRPYLDGEPPDSMSQITLVAAMRDWERLRGEALPLADRLEAGIGRFHDRKLGAMRRYLPNAPKEKDRDEADSWYLYYPLLGLLRLALAGDERARGLFMRSADYAIRAARHFRYRFPIKFKMSSFAVITAVRGDERHGQTDVAGLYAYVMLLAFELTQERRFLDEARAALEAARGLRFNLNYQANLTAWGAAAAARLWRVTGEESWRQLAYVYLASFLHNCAAWESQIGQARHHPNFLGVTALHDARYMALLECSESFLAFHSLLRDSAGGLLPSAHLLVDAFCRFALDRAWFFFPQELPPEAVADDPRTGRIDRALAFPLEDLYLDGQPGGQVGQEVYGAGAAFIFAAHAFRRIEGAPFDVFCDSFVLNLERPGARSALLTLAGYAANTARLVLLPHGRRPVRARVALGDGRPRRGESAGAARAFKIPANAVVTLTW
jgi:hypothetical protein